MKPRSLLVVKFLRIFFLITEVCTGVVLPLCLVGFLIVAHRHSGFVPKSIILSPIGLSSDSHFAEWKSATGATAPITLEHFSGAIRVAHPDDYQGYKAATAPAIGFGLLVLSAAACAISDLLRRLFSNVAKGAVFVGANVNYMRWVGMLVFIFSLCLHFVQRWQAAAVYAFASSHLVASGFSFSPPRDATWLVVFQNLIFGLIILVFAEVFNQGLVLKEDNDLTV